MGLSVTHLYGLTESFAPATVCMWQPALDSMSVEERSAFMARPDEKWGETPHAFVTLKPGAEPVTREAIVAWCRAHMAGFEIPRHVTLGPLPKTSTGKIQKFELRARIAAAG